MNVATRQNPKRERTEDPNLAVLVRRHVPIEEALGRAYKVGADMLTNKQPNISSNKQLDRLMIESSHTGLPWPTREYLIPYPKQKSTTNSQ